MSTKVCKQCGSTKDIDNFRQYYNGGNSRYNVCKDCERINSRLKYLEKKSKPTDEETEEINLIYLLYGEQEASGLKPPRRGKKEVGVLNATKDMLAKLADKNAELHEWLTKDLSSYTPDELDEVYDNLRAKYKPVIGTGPDLLPIYDDTHKVTLDKVLVRFDDYEEDYYDKLQ